MRNLPLGLLVTAAALPHTAAAPVHFTSQANLLALNFTLQDFSDARIDGANTTARPMRPVTHE